MRAAAFEPWPGACNTHDLGGVRLEGGGRAVAGRLYRSGQLGSVAAPGWAAMESLGVRTIVDLRNDDQRAATPTIGAPVPCLHRPVEDLTDRAFMDRYGELLAHPTYFAGVVEHFPAKLGAAIDAVVGSPPGVLVHCSAGRDRTGMVVALVLRLAGVVIEDVVADYERGVRGYHAWKLAHPHRARERLHYADELEAIVTETNQALGEWLDGLDVPALCADRLGTGGEVVDRASALLSG